MTGIVAAGLVLVAGAAGATSIHRVPRPEARHERVSLRTLAVFSHSFLGAGPLGGEVMQAHVPAGLAIGRHRHHRWTGPSSPGLPAGDEGSVPGVKPGSDQPPTAPGVPEPAAALLFATGSLLVASTLRRRMAAA